MKSLILDTVSVFGIKIALCKYKCLPIISDFYVI